MKVEIELVETADLEEALIRTVQVKDSIEQAKMLLEGEQKGIIVTKGDKKYLCEPSKIYYIESVDNNCFVYTKTDCYEIKSKLYELESTLDYRFFRCSKSMICNVKKIKSVKSLYNSKMEATLLNDEVIMINRSYIQELKKRLV